VDCCAAFTLVCRNWDLDMLDQLDDLTSKLLDSSLDPSERARLNQLLKSAECRDRFVELNKIHFCLTQRTASVTTLRTARAASAVHESILRIAKPTNGRVAAFDAASCDGDCRGLADRLQANRGRLASVVAACAAVAAVVLFLTFGGPGQEEPQRERPIEMAVRKSPKTPADVVPAVRAVEDPSGHAEVFAARLVSMSDQTVWERDGAPGDFLMRLTVGEELKLIRGLVKLEFAAQASVVLSGPAELKILGPGEVLLRHGKLSGRSEEGDFVVQTPSAYVVDVGTAFGVAVDRKAVTDVVVFDGEVHVQRSSASIDKLKLTSGMAARADGTGLNASHNLGSAPAFDREFNGQRPTNLGPNELSVIDIICGSAPGEYRSAGSIDPELGTWSTLPWSESKGVHGKSGTGKMVPVEWNPWVHGIFIPTPKSDRLTIDLAGHSVPSPALMGGAWGPVWARRRIERHLDPLASQADRDVEGFWGAGTTTALLDRSRWVRDGVVGLHANVGITLDLDAIRRGYGVSLKSLRGVVAHLEQSYVSQPFQPQALSTFQIYVDGEMRYERSSFCRQDGDAMFGTELGDSDRLLSVVVTDGNDGPVYDRVILLDPLFEIARTDH
jgi:hypothetical protein